MALSQPGREGPSGRSRRWSRLTTATIQPSQGTFAPGAGLAVTQSIRHPPAEQSLPCSLRVRSLQL